MWYAPLIGHLSRTIDSSSHPVDHRRLAGVRCIQIRRLASRRRCRAARRFNRYQPIPPSVAYMQKSSHKSMTLNSGERCHQSVLRSASTGSASPSSVRALANRHSQRQGTANQAARVIRTFTSTLCGALMAHAWLLQSVLQRGSPALPAGHAQTRQRDCPARRDRL